MTALPSPTQARTFSPSGPMSPALSGMLSISSSIGAPPTTSPTQERKSSDQSPRSLPLPQAQALPIELSTEPQPYTIFLRRLPSSMTKEALTSMLLFAEDFIDATFVTQDLPEDRGFLSALARFKNLDGAQEVRRKLHGKVNSTNEATMIVYLLSGDASTSPGKAETNQFGRQLSNTSSGSSSGTLTRQSSRYNSTFKSMDKSSPPSSAPAMINEDHSGEVSNQTKNGSPPMPNHLGRNRISGKSVIIKDVLDEETGELLKDPLAYASSTARVGVAPTSAISPQRHPAAHHQHLNLSRLANLSLNTNDDYGPQQRLALQQQDGMTSPTRMPPSMRSPGSEMPPMVMMSSGPMSPSMYPMGPSQYQRHQYPPANPADQNPPCNTLYVGNLPADTSEDELKAMFSKQRGYKRLCFRTKHNGPMCFVEFDDVSYATKALNELYGHPLHNSIKGGIRLSFSKNPLGVRTGQGNGMGPTSPLSPTGGMNGYGSPPGFATANGPPPGLAAPPRMQSPVGHAESPGFSPPRSGYQGPLYSPTRGLGPGSGLGSPLYSHGMSYGLDAISNGFPNAFMLDRRFRENEDPGLTPAPF